MSAFRFIHSSDLHLGRRFSNLPEEIRGRLQEARHDVLARLAEAARGHGAGWVLIAGDVFDSETPSDPVWRQALAAMGAASDLDWGLLPGNHDSLAAETLWERLSAQAPPNVHPLLEAGAREIAAGVRLLPAPLPRRHPGRDLTAWMDAAETPPGALRLGLAHGPVQSFGETAPDAAEVIPPDRAARAGLDYLALGDWHGAMRIGPRTRYCGAPERDRFKHPGRGSCLAVTLPGPGAEPEAETVETGRFDWAEAALELLPGQDAAAALRALLPAPEARRDMLLRVRASGRAGLAEQEALRRAAAAAGPEFGWFVLETDALAADLEAEDLDEIDRGGALRAAAEDLRAQALDPDRSAEDRGVAQAALNRLYAFAREAEA